MFNRPDKLVIDTHRCRQMDTHVHMDTQIQATTIPKGQIWPQAKINKISVDASFPLGVKSKWGWACWDQSWDTVEHDKKLIMPGETHNESAHPIWAQSDQRFVYKCTETTQPVQHDLKLIRQGESCYNELAHQIWTKSDQRFVFKCIETAQPIRGQQGWGQVKYLYLVLDANYRVLGTYLYLTFWNSKVLGTYLYLMAKVLDTCPSTQVFLSN